MKNGLDKLFMSDRVLYAMPWIYAITTLAYGIMIITFNVSQSIFDLGIEIINVLTVFGITVSYKAHEKNIMKTLFGALMMGGIIYFFSWVNIYIGKPEYTFALISNAIITLLYIVLFINHLVLGYGHKANPSRTSLNRVAGILIVLCVVIECVPFYTSVEYTVASLLAIISEAAIIIEILCIETKVDAYKIIRENK